MSARFPMGFLGLALAWVAFEMMSFSALAQDSSATVASGNWLAPKPSGETSKTTGTAVGTDPFAVIAGGSLWEQTQGERYTRQLGDGCTLLCQGSDAVVDDTGQGLSQSQQAGLQFQPMAAVTLSGDFHTSATDALIPDASSTASGAAFAAQGRASSGSLLGVGFHLDRAAVDAPAGAATETTGGNIQVEQPLGRLPLSARFKGDFEQFSTAGGPQTSLPSLEQSLVWKPASNATLQMGLRQQQYQEFPGVDHQLNEALFADWSEKVIDNLSWHSYAEVLNTKGLLDQAPASPLATGANGTPQATTPASNAGLTSSLPISLDEQTVTFATGPSFQLQKDISASLEYSDRWDKNPAAGSTGQEQRVSVSVKGSF